MTATLALSPETSAHLRDGLDALLGNRVLVPLEVVAEIFQIPSREAVLRRIERGSLPLSTVQVGTAFTPMLVPVADIYTALGLEYTPKQAL